MLKEKNIGTHAIGKNKTIWYIQDFTTNYQVSLEYTKKGVFRNGHIRILSEMTVL